MPNTSALTALAVQLDAARAALAQAERLARQLQERAQAAEAEAAAARQEVQRLAWVEPPVGPDGSPIKRGRGRPVGSKDSTGGHREQSRRCCRSSFDTG